MVRAAPPRATRRWNSISSSVTRPLGITPSKVAALVIRLRSISGPRRNGVAASSSLTIARAPAGPTYARASAAWFRRFSRSTASRYSSTRRWITALVLSTLLSWPTTWPTGLNITDSALSE